MAVGVLVWMTADKNMVKLVFVGYILMEAVSEIENVVTFTTDEMEPLTTNDDLVIEMVGFDAVIAFVVALMVSDSLLAIGITEVVGFISGVVFMMVFFMTGDTVIFITGDMVLCTITFAVADVVVFVSIEDAFVAFITIAEVIDAFVAVAKPVIILGDAVTVILIDGLVTFDVGEVEMLVAINGAMVVFLKEDSVVLGDVVAFTMISVVVLPGITNREVLMLDVILVSILRDELLVFIPV